MCATTVSGKSVNRTKPLFKVQGAYLPALGHLDSFRYLGLQFGSTGSARPTVFNLSMWLKNLERAPLKPDQKFLVLKTYLVTRLHHGLQAPSVTGKILCECDRLIRKSTKRILHLATQTGSQFLHAAVRDGGLGIPQLRRVIPDILQRRVDNLASLDVFTKRVLTVEGPAKAFNTRVRHLAGLGPPNAYWREEIASRPLSAGLEAVVENAASRSWIG